MAELGDESLHTFNVILKRQFKFQFQQRKEPPKNQITLDLWLFQCQFTNDSCYRGFGMWARQGLVEYIRKRT